jgi:nucleoside-diphosphate-sugar epimerase
MSTILVTGASGLIGRAVIERLRQSGRPVLAVDREASADAGFSIEIAELTDADRLSALVARGIDGIIHCGGISGPAVAQGEPARIAAVNIGGTVNLLEAARIHRVRRFVYCSSIAAYGATPAGMSLVGESAPLAAIDIYGASKVAADLMVRAYAGEHGVDAVALRIGWVYGPRRRTPSLTQRMIADAVKGVPTVVEHNGSFAVQLVHVDDVVDALIAAYGARELPSSAYNVTGGQRLTFREVAARVTAILPQARIQFASDAAAGGPDQALFDIAMAARDVGWSPRVDLDDGIARTAQWCAASQQ